MSSTNGQNVHGALAEFDNPAELIKAAEQVREAGYTDFDCHSPFPIHGMDAAMGLKQSILGFVVGTMGAIGLLGGIGLQWWSATQAYALVISGKPLFSFQAFVPVTFEITILLSAFGAVFGMFHLNRIPQLWHYLFFSENFQKATDDGFFVSIDATDGQFDATATSKFLESIGGKSIEVLEG